MSDLDQSPAQPYDYTSRGPTQGWLKNYSLGGGGGGTPGGATTQIQFNDTGAFAGDSNFTWDSANDELSINSPSLTPNGGRITTSSDITAWLAIWQSYGNSSSDAGMLFSKTRASTLAGTAALLNNDTIASFYFFGDGGAGGVPAAIFEVDVDGNPGPADMPGRFVFYTTPDGSNVVVERLRIGNQGFVSLPNSCLGRAAPVTKTADFAVATTENWLINNKVGSSCTVTLPVAANFSGREIMFNNYQAQTVVSASANVVQQTGATTTTAILAATAGKWATLVSNGTNWVIMQSGG